ncbi:MAG: SDR family oxidoreductase [Opitutaceae bacterium]|nr:SDR family oxidoreductase [Opitutaceae bacterium]
MHIVLTGSSTGIGRALAERLLSRGHHIWGLARSDQSDFAASHPNFRFSRCDVSNYPAVAAAASTYAAAWPHLDAVICAAGIQGEIAPALTANPLKWSATIRANLDGTYFALRAFASLLVQPAPAASRKKIVCFSGGGATKPRVNFSAYGVAKTALVRLVETIAEENRDQPLDINALAPGAVNTRLTDEILALGPSVVGTAEYTAAQKQRAAALSSATSGAIADPALTRALDCVEWLLSPASDGITGRLLSAPWDPWLTLGDHRAALAASDVYTLRRTVPADRGQKW